MVSPAAEMSDGPEDGLLGAGLLSDEDTGGCETGGAVEDVVGSLPAALPQAASTAAAQASAATSSRRLMSPSSLLRYGVHVNFGSGKPG